MPASRAAFAADASCQVGQGTVATDETRTSSAASRRKGPHGRAFGIMMSFRPGEPAGPMSVFDHARRQSLE